VAKNQSEREEMKNFNITYKSGRQYIVEGDVYHDAIAGTWHAEPKSIVDVVTIQEVLVPQYQINTVYDRVYGDEFREMVKFAGENDAALLILNGWMSYIISKFGNRGELSWVRAFDDMSGKIGDDVIDIVAKELDNQPETIKIVSRDQALAELVRACTGKRREILL
jgi:MoaA/NifB/PqqE/SkfB family radical SAM enzyme